MSVKDVLQECCKRLDAGHFTITGIIVVLPFTGTFSKILLHVACMYSFLQCFSTSEGVHGGGLCVKDSSHISENPSTCRLAQTCVVWQEGIFNCLIYCFTPLSIANILT